MLIACSGQQKNDILTPEERLNRQIAIADAQDDDSDRFDESATVYEEEAVFDEQSATHELKRASLNAEDCPNTFTKEQLGDYSPGKATVNLTFQSDGTVKDISVSPYGDTPVGGCIVRAIGTVRVEPFKGAEVQKTWELDMKAPKKTQK